MKKSTKRLIFQLVLVVLTLLSTTAAGAEWIYGYYFLYVPEPLGWAEFLDGLRYSLPFLLILTVHEFGHYFTARYHKVKVSLPYYFPFWLGFLGSMSLGTMGAFIRIRQRLSSVKQTFDIGVAGPLAGFVVALLVLWYGFTHLPPKEYIYKIHPEYQLFGANYQDIVYSKDTFFLKSDVAKLAPKQAARLPYDTIYMHPNNGLNLSIGSSILFDYMKAHWVPETQLDRLPNSHEIMHYPYLLAGFFALMFTALNLLPVGQLDGGHVVFGMFGARAHNFISKSFYLIAIVYAGLGVGFMGFINPFVFNIPLTDALLHLLLYIALLYYLVQKVFATHLTRLMVALAIYVTQAGLLYIWPHTTGYSGWFLFILILGRFIRVQHPMAEDTRRLSPFRLVLGGIALLIFILCFSLKPLIIG